MISTQWLWRLVGTAAGLSTLLCAAGFIYGANRIINPQPVVTDAPASPAAPAAQGAGEAWEAKDGIRIVALGDSLTAGIGDLAGKGYVGYVKDKLAEQTGKPVFVYNNFAIQGFRTYDLVKDWDAKQDIAKSLAEADLVLLTIGGNDLFEGGADIISSNEGFNPKAASERMPEALKGLSEVLDRVSGASPKARIMYVGLYHPFLDLDPNRTGAPVLQAWNSAAFELTARYPNVTFVPTYDLFELNLGKYLFTDHFHPNAAGYERIAARIADILR